MTRYSLKAETKAVLKRKGLIQIDKDEKKEKECIQSHAINPPGLMFCGRCGRALIVKTAIELQEKQELASEASEVGIEEVLTKESKLQKIIKKEIQRQVKLQRLCTLIEFSAQ